MRAIKTGYKDDKSRRLYIVGGKHKDGSLLYSIIYVGVTSKSTKDRIKEHKESKGAIIFKKESIDTHPCDGCKFLIGHNPPQYKVTNELYSICGKSELDEDIITCISFIAFGERHVFGGRFASTKYKDLWIKKLNIKKLREKYYSELLKQLENESMSVNDKIPYGFMHFGYFGQRDKKYIWMITQDSESSSFVKEVFEFIILNMLSTLENLDQKTLLSFPEVLAR